MPEINEVELSNYQRRLLMELRARLACHEAVAANIKETMALVLNAVVEDAGAEPGQPWRLTGDGTKLRRVVPLEPTGTAGQGSPPNLN